MMSMAAAPSVVCEALPAVVCQRICGKRADSSALSNTGLSVASFSTVVLGRMVSSAVTRPAGVSMPTISRAKAPLVCAACARWCERAA
jgi:hypothetical protein